jgi:hypothetical protein
LPTVRVKHSLEKFVAGRQNQASKVPFSLCQSMLIDLWVEGEFALVME